ncbi:MAG: type II toxin-antitoxin system VapC family toxin [Methanobrevibacter sp.]|nr:type II toxin-antitoxin system VapC family toxin [Methanobrevibacter sp.]
MIMEIYYVLDASAFINGFKLNSNNNYTVPEITAEIKDFESRLVFDMAIDEGLLVIQDVSSEYVSCVNNIISESGDILRLSQPDTKLIALAYMFSKQGKNVKVISDDYTIQNTLKIMNIPYSGIITEGIKGIYNWKKVCEGCKKEFDEDYPFDDCEICGSKIFKKRIKVNK